LGAGKPTSKEKGHEGVNFAQIFHAELKKGSTSTCRRARNITAMNQKATMTLTTVPEVACQIALGN
jgi:hypothetical protein